MIRASTCPSIDFACGVDASPTELCISLDAREKGPLWIQVFMDEPEIRKALAKFLLAKFRPLCECEDMHRTKLRCFAWLLGVLKNEGGLNPTETPLLVEFVPPSLNGEPDFVV